MKRRNPGFYRIIARIAIMALLVSGAFNFVQAGRIRMLSVEVDELSTSATSNNPESTIPTKPIPSPTVTPAITPAISPGQPESAETLRRQLAAALTGEMLAGNPTATRLEERTTYLMPTIQKYVYLTFDDGPSQYTPMLLEILQRNHVPATFFVRYDATQDYYRQIVAAGHTLALHTYSHDYAQIYASETAFFEDLNNISAYVKSITGIDSKIVRLAGGSSNTISRNYNKGVVTRIVGQLNSQGYAYFDWNAQGMDATTPGITAADIVKNVKSFTYVNGVAKPFIMLLLHNGIDEPTTPDAVQAIIDYYKGLGYLFEKITKDTPVVHQPIQN